MLNDTTVSIVLIAFWGVVIVYDLMTRRVSVAALVILIILSLIGRAWPWWLAAPVVLLWPRRDRATLLAMPALALGVLTNNPAPALAMATGALAWGLGWWGGADSIVLMALGLRYGFYGLIAGAAMSGLTAGVLMLKRRRSALGVLAALPEAMNLQARESGDIPADAEMPAAATMALAGIGLEVVMLMGVILR